MRKAYSRLRSTPISDKPISVNAASQAFAMSTRGVKEERLLLVHPSFGVQRQKRRHCRHSGVLLRFDTRYSWTLAGSKCTRPPRRRWWRCCCWPLPRRARAPRQTRQTAPRSRALQGRTAREELRVKRGKGQGNISTLIQAEHLLLPCMPCAMGIQILTVYNYISHTVRTARTTR